MPVFSLVMIPTFMPAFWKEQQPHAVARVELFHGITPGGVIHTPVSQRPVYIGQKKFYSVHCLILN